MSAQNSSIRLISGAWGDTFAEVVASAKERVVLCAPYVKREGAKTVARARTGKSAIGARSLVLTDLSARAVCAGATDPGAVVSVGDALKGSKIVHLPGLHAKVYVADGRRAVVTSGNLTVGGLSRNYEYGVLMNEPALASEVERDVLEYATLGAEMDAPTLASYCEAAIDARKAFDAQESSASRAIQKRLASALTFADDTLIRARLASGAIHTVFAKTIVYLLRKHGPLSTAHLHPLVQRLHPDLCDDLIDRVIDGQRFGKKWKHAVRTAQQQLKKAGRVALEDDHWRLIGD